MRQVSPPWKCWINPHATTAEECRCCARRHEIEQPVGLQDNVDEWLDWLLTQLVIPSFRTDGFTFIYDYPRTQSALAKLYKNQSGYTVAARFELFYGEIELANGFDELLDAGEQRQRFERENLARQAADQRDDQPCRAVEGGEGDDRAEDPEPAPVFFTSFDR